MKTIKIDKELHKELKIYCASNNLNIKSFVETLIKKELNKNGKNI